MGQMGYGGGDNSPAGVYSVTVPNGSGGNTSRQPSLVNPNQKQDPTYPCVGLWAAAYDDNVVDFGGNITIPVSDLLDPSGNRWVHDDELNQGWLQAGFFSYNINDGCGPINTTMAFPPAPGSNPLTSTAGQTWPIRGAEEAVPINREGFRSDIKLLLTTLMNPDVRNFFGRGHGNPNQFLGIPMARLGTLVPQRYRFVFLCGCATYSFVNFSAFKAIATEVPPQSLSSSDQGFTDASFYELSGLRPAAFMGNLIDEIGYYDVSPADTDPTTHKTCTMRNIEATGNWHKQFLFYWIEEGFQLYQAKLQADNLTWGPIANPQPPPLAQLVVESDANGNPIYYSPVTALKIGGYLPLKFNELNHANDSW